MCGRLDLSGKRAFKELRSSVAVWHSAVCHVMSSLLGGVAGIVLGLFTLRASLTHQVLKTVKESRKESRPHDKLLQERLSKLVERWPEVQVRDHNLNALEIEAYNITCKPKVWLLLSSLYRTFKSVRGSMKDMLRQSAGDCWFVTLLVSNDVERSVLLDDAAFFEHRFSFISVTRSTKVMKNRSYMYPVHWYGCFLSAQLVVDFAPHLLGDMETTVVLRHRPDECFRRCFQLENLQRVLGTWGYLIFGQPVSADNGLTTNWKTYKEIIAEGLLKTDFSIENLAARISSWSAEYCQGIVYPKECYGQVPYCLMNSNMAPCRPPVFLSWQQHCLCRSSRNGTFCMDKKAPSLPVERPCLDITKDTKCLLPRSGVKGIPKVLQPPEEQLLGGLEEHEIVYMRPTKGFKECRRGRDLGA